MLRREATLVAGLLGLALSAGCDMGAQPMRPEPTPSQSARLRIANVGALPIRSLTVLFPEDQVHFGDVAAGETSRYVDVPHGIYRYAAYRFEKGGALVTQPVIDWVGERPMGGESFTYKLAATDQGIELVMVNIDNE